MRHKLRRFNQGLWISPEETQIPDGALRRNRGAHPTKTSSLRTRNGMTLKYTRNAHSISRFSDEWVWGASTVFGKENTELKTGLNGDRLSMVPMPPSPGMEDYLFISGGGSLFKVDPAGNVTNWGIEAPDTSLMSAAVATGKYKTIDDMEDIGGLYDECDSRWTDADDLDGTGIVLPTLGAAGFGKGGDARQGSNTLIVGFETNTNTSFGIASDLHTILGGDLNLTEFTGGTASVEEDFISFWLLLYRPYRWQYLQLDFSIDRTDFQGVVYSRRLVPEGDYVSTTWGSSSYVQPPPVTIVAASSSDLASLEVEHAERQTIPFYARGGEHAGEGKGALSTFGPKVVRGSVQRAWTEQFSAVKLYNRACVWQHVKISKSIFERSGTGQRSHGEWAHVRAVRLLGYYVVTGDLDEGLTAPFGDYLILDGLRLTGGAGMAGTYQYAVTYRNSATGTSSNPGDDIVMVEDISREGVSLSGIPTSSDPQVDQREIWRTIGGGSIFWRCDIIDNNLDTTYTDVVSDPHLNYDSDAVILEPTELQIDNYVPYSSFDASIYHLGHVFWIDRSTEDYRGNLYYSPVGRVEAMKGYIPVSSAEDPLQALFRWNESLFAMSEGGIFRIEGSYPFVARRVYGCPGTKAPHTVAVTEYGVFYEADQGIRHFNGMSSAPAGHEAVASLFRGEASEQLTSFTGVVAAAGKEEYFISDGSQTLALHLQDKTWRDHGRGFSAIYYSPDEQEILATYSGLIYEIEVEGKYEDGSGDIPVYIKPKVILLDEEKEVLVHRVHIDCDLSSETLNVYVLLDGASTSLGTISNSSRDTETIPIGKYAQRVGLYIYGDVNSSIEIYGIEFDTNAPGESR